MSDEHNWVIACGVPVDCGTRRPSHAGSSRKRVPLDVEIVDGVCAIRLQGAKAAGRKVFLDESDLHLVAPYSWHAFSWLTASGHAFGPYAANTFLDAGRVRSALMHKLLTGWPLTDHIDHDTLNNRRSNLRPATPAQSNANTRKTVRKCASQFKGVTHDGRSRTSSWRAQIGINGTRFRLGAFPTQEEAARAYDAAAFAAWGEYAYLNFPLTAEAVAHARGAA